VKEPEVPRLEAAQAFARERHAGQMRKDGRTQYVVHPLRVAERLRSVGVADEDVLAAAVLHDVVEDTPTTTTDVAERFGSVVAAWVAAVSRAPGETRAAFTERIAHAPPQACLIKLADRLDNLHDWTGMPPEFRRPYLVEAIDLVRAVLANPRLAELDAGQLRAVWGLAAQLLAVVHAELRVGKGGASRRSRGPKGRRRP
jgi:guanosine-3',5'-bis(diphosphate) 3'-pyrophosphohydrolase